MIQLTYISEYDINVTINFYKNTFNYLIYATESPSVILTATNNFIVVNNYLHKFKSIIYYNEKKNYIFSSLI